MTSSNGIIFRITGHFYGELVTAEFPAQRPVTRSFDVFFDRRLNKRLSKQWWCWWFEMLSRELWRHCNDKKRCWYCLAFAGVQAIGHLTWLIWVNDITWDLNLRSFRREKYIDQKNDFGEFKYTGELHHKIYGRKYTLKSFRNLFWPSTFVHIIGTKCQHMSFIVTCLFVINFSYQISR